jgi:hypothetical protein
MNGGLDLEQRYRRVLRLLPGYYRDKWEEDMVAAFLDGWLTGDPERDECILEFCKPTWDEIASVAGLAAELYLGSATAPYRYFAWGQAIRNAVLAMMLLHAVFGLNGLVVLAASRYQFAWLPTSSVGIWGAVWASTGYAWVVAFVLLVLGHNRTARFITALAVIADLVAVLQAQLASSLPLAYGAWAHWCLIDLVPALAMSAFHRSAPPVARQWWLLAMPVGYALVVVPIIAAHATGQTAWLPDFSGLCCLLVALACLAHAARARSRQAVHSSVWSLTLALLAAVIGVDRIVSALGDYLHDAHLIGVSGAELAILAAAAALVVSDAARAQAAIAAPPRYPQLR